MSSIEHADVTLKMPSVLAELAEEDFLLCGVLFQFRCFSKNKHDLIFYSLVLRLRTILAAISVIIIPIAQIFVTFSAIKSWVVLMRKNTGQTFILVPATPLTRKALGLSSTECAATFVGSITSGFFGCHQSWDSVLGENGIFRQQETNVI